MTHPTLIVATDAKTARFLIRRDPGAPLEEAGEEALAALRLIAPAARRQHGAGSDESASGARLEAVFDEASAEHGFLHQLASLIDDQAIKKRFRRWVLCAPPHVLCILRDHVAGSTRQLLVCEITQDLASAPIPAIEAQLAAFHI